MILTAVAAFALATGAQAHGSGYWGPEVQKQIIAASQDPDIVREYMRRSLEQGTFDIANMTPQEVYNVAKAAGAPSRILRSTSLSRYWLFAVAGRN
jgi:hypothetical protein